MKFYLSAGVKEIVGESGVATGVMLPSGEVLKADLVVAGVGELHVDTSSLWVPPPTHDCLI